jgi:ribosomal protein L7/L12
LYKNPKALKEGVSKPNEEELKKILEDGVIF